MPEVDKEELLRLIDQHKIIPLIRSLKDTEAVAIVQLKTMLLSGDLQKLIKCSPIRSYKFEYNFGIGRADLVLFHQDLGVTIIEAKANSGIRTIAAGIGQLFLYESAAMKKFHGKHAPKYIKKILCAAVIPEECLPVWEACRLADIHFLSLADYKQLMGFFAKILAEH